MLFIKKDIISILQIENNTSNHIIIININIILKAN